MAKYDGSAIGVGEFLVYMKVTLMLLWLKVFLFLPEWPQVGHSQRVGPPEVVIPLRVTPTGRGMKLQGWLCYKLHFGGQRHVVHMKVKKNFLSKNFPVFTYADTGVLLEDQPFVQDDCYYRGYVEGDPESLVSLNNCFGGFQGMLQTNDIVYEIEPKRFSTAFEHLIYKLDNEETNFSYFRCGLTDEEIAGQLKFQESINSTLKQSSYAGWWTHSYFLEVAVVVDHSRYLHHGSNTSLVQKEVFLVLNVVSDVLKTLDLELLLMGIEIWTERSLVALGGGIRKALDEFCKWKENGLQNRVPHDLAHIFVKKHYGNTIGWSFIGTVCSDRYSCGIESFHDEGVSTLSHVVIHETSHVLGMNHDNTNLCKCAASRCIMFPYVGVTTKYTNCSYADYWNLVHRRHCLYIAPDPLTVLRETRCGNSVVEEGEECDCGPVKKCTADPCCQLNCTMTAGVNCSSGLCCHNCRFMPSGTVCRKVENECDLPEWCNGTSSQCPEDVYMQDGTSCTGGGYCYEKRCNERNEQCRQIFGQEARSANNDMICNGICCCHYTVPCSKAVSAFHSEAIQTTYQMTFIELKLDHAFATRQPASDPARSLLNKKGPAMVSPFTVLVFLVFWDTGLAALTETHGDKDSPACYNCVRKLKDQEETQMPKGKNHVLQTICLKLRKKGTVCLEMMERQSVLALDVVATVTLAVNWDGNGSPSVTMYCLAA
ncbi:hypothetical protein MG293_007352 [Ovis ammon polii]|uniref:Disintegrin and metalloproteinase domain-containing protein 20-like n=1 Tax=Ovis ammon polii TaxID=230172 RepID=A0AAD4U9L1_OVIAM|nr:hypothetical protein MG293_007352 [Ovis ammon polii]